MRDENSVYILMVASQARTLGRVWRYTVEWWRARQNGRAIVRVESGPRARERVVACRVWSARTGARTAATVLLASLTQGGSPVLGASLELRAELETENGTVAVLLPARMVDDGAADPDTLGGNGVYSALLPAHPVSGRYTLTVAVNTASATTFLPGESEARPAIPVQRTVPGPALSLATPQPPPRPARITNLQISNEGAGLLVASWSPVRGPSPAGYKVVFSPDIGQLLDGTGEPEVLAELEGGADTAVLGLSRYGREHYLALVGVGADGQLGPISNIVCVLQESLPSSSVPAPVLEITASDRDWIMVAVVCAIFTVLLCMTTVMASYLCWHRYRRKAAKPAALRGSASDVNAGSSSGCSDQTDASSFDLEMKPGCGLELSGTESPAPPRTTPIYWSASQLLSKLDTEQLPGYSLSPAPHPAHNIPDEFCVTVSDLHYTAAGSPYSDCSAGLGRDWEPAGPGDGWEPQQPRQPPPVLPKPKNITQV